MRMACSTNGREEKWILERWDGIVRDWIDLAQDRDKWRALMITVINLWVQ
jgi:hypothetical protein